MVKRGKLFSELHTRFRRRRFQIVNDLVRELLGSKDHLRILDVGGYATYWNMLSPDLRERTHITCLNYESELSLYENADHNLTIENLVGDGCNMREFKDGSFDLVHSNSVIEHVGTLQNMQRFAEETRRVGGAYYVQTPNFWFPIEPHFAFPLLHWLPEQARLWLHTRISLGYAKKCSFETALIRLDHTRMISRFMVRNLFPDGDVKVERFFLLPKSIIAIRK